MSQHRASHGRARTKTVRSHARAGSPRVRIIAASGIVLALGGAVALTLQGGSDGTGGTASDKPQGRQSVEDRAAEGNAVRVQAAYAEESRAAEAEDRRMAEEEEGIGARAAETARENRRAAERKREAAADDARAKTAQEERERQKEEAEAVTAAGNGGFRPGGSSSTGMSADEHRLISLLNERRVALGLPPVEESADLTGQAEECSVRSLEKGALEHCGHEVLFMGGENTTPEAMIEAWFNSPGHKTALTYGSSTTAGAAVVTDSAGRLVAAINIDY
ncbi:CAP domain-containing protein [Streptomyces sp. NPDC058008]|uniref:CAP domain-containing protein n=1 Tax=Streptomyces sp. NPDC058008 TaxID=3346303 RepID=UPI0036E30357